MGEEGSNYGRLCASQAAEDHVLAQLRDAAKQAGLKVRKHSLRSLDPALSSIAVLHAAKHGWRRGTP